jgi:hypothetical protein
MCELRTIERTVVMQVMANERELCSGTPFVCDRHCALGYPYAGYRVAVFSKTEEQRSVGGHLGGLATYHSGEALAAAGLEVENAAPWISKVMTIAK